MSQQEHHDESFVWKYIFSQDHKVIGVQYGITSMLFLFFGFVLMMIMRWQLAFPDTPVPIVGSLLSEEGLLSPDMQEEIIGSAEVRDTFKISKLGTIAGCMVTSGKITRNSGVRVIREENVIFDGKLSSLKRFKDDAKEVAKGYDCGIQIIDFNDVQVGDLIESYEEIAVRKKL